MDKIQLESSPLCAYTYHEAGIHELRYLQPTREGWDACLKLMQKAADSTPEGETVRMIIDATAGAVPLNYASRKAKEWVKANPNPPMIRTVILYRNSLLLRIAEAMIRSLYSAKTVTRFFPITKRDEAMEWLLSK